MDIQKNIVRQALKSTSLKTLLGEIINVKEIGQGGNGLVFSGLIHGHEVAFKVLVNSNKEKLERFKAEYLFMNFLPSNKYVTKSIYYDEINIADTVFPVIVMKKYDGPLKISSKTPATFEELGNLFQFLLNTLKFIHHYGVIHRDIKPQNILVNSRGFVLADFGIASFNPDIFKDKNFETKKGDRLGNFFSAPEQTMGSAPHPTMDIYALGQICQWYVTGTVHHGTKRETFTKIISESELIDLIVDKCLANKPDERFQSINDIELFISEYKDREQQVKIDIWKYLRLFDEALVASFPRSHSNKAYYSDDLRQINRLLNKLKELEFDNRLLWLDGIGDNYITDLQQLNDEIWLIDKVESKIKSIWYYIDSSIYCDFILLNFEAMPPFGIYDNSSQYEEVGLVNGAKYISRTEYDNGYAEIDGDIIKLSDHVVDLRCRYLEDRSIFITTEFSSAYQRKSEVIVREFIEKISTGYSLTEADFKLFVSQIRKNKHIDVLMSL